MKKNIILTFSLFISILSYSQLKVMPSGYVGIGTNNPLEKLHVNGRIYLTGNNNTFRILPNNPGTEIGTSTDRIDFWFSSTYHNKLYAEAFYTQSDSTTKVNIAPLQNGLDVISSLRTYSYNLITDVEHVDEKLSFGLLAQEVEAVLPQIVDTSKGIMLINYTEFIPFLILSIQEQQLQIENLQTIILSQEQEIISLTNTVNGCCFELSEKSTNVDDNTLQNEAKLYQNNPNPFSVSTNIKYSIPNKFMSAYLNIYNLNGGQIKSYKISNVGNGNIKIDGLELNPGMYLYSLIIDNNIIDTKKMVLTD